MPAGASCVDCHAGATHRTMARGARHAAKGAAASRIPERTECGQVNERINFGSGAPWEPVVGYSRAVRVGAQVWVAGTTATGTDGKLVGVGDAYAQTRQALANVAAALARAGARVEDVVRTRLFVTDMTQWEAVGRAHGEVFASIRPASTMVEVTRLIDPDMLVEIEADAVITLT
jgi:enamine deaminase RidA (YjgF/YER057c/UK114 family)